MLWAELMYALYGILYSALIILFNVAAIYLLIEYGPTIISFLL